MATLFNIVICSWWIFILVPTLETLKYGSVESQRILDENDLAPKPKGTIKTIEVSKDGYLIDCVDIYKQPSLYNQPIKDLQMKPYRRSFNKTNSPQFEKQNNRLPNQMENWHKYGKCPKGTIPIRRIWNNNVTVFQKHHDDRDDREYATTTEENGPFHGAEGFFSLWNPHVSSADEFSLAQIWITSGEDSNLESIEVGWQVYPGFYRNYSTVLFIYWTADGYQHGCYNHGCPGRGFHQTKPDICIGCPVPSDLSEYGGVANDLSILVDRDRVTGNWRLYVKGTEVGYFPRELFTRLGDGADEVELGGEIVNKEHGGRHTSTQMGSGHFSTEGFRRASYIRNIKIVNRRYRSVNAKLNLFATKSGCYDVSAGPPRTNFGTHFYYGGPGYSPQHCP